ncbi:hypothetical protein C1I36_03405 [Dehalobacter sp. 14DCB1]|nr:hypothetical protein C1I36_03405 [Dehalobacter sp. 14DCB1]
MLCPLRKQTIQKEERSATDNNKVYTVTKWKSTEDFLPCIKEQCQMYDKDNIICRLRFPI